MTNLEQALVRAMARRCRLEDPDEFATQRRYHGPCPKGARDRGTGRTTAMLLRAFVAHEAGCSVEIVAADRRHAGDLVDRVRVLARKAGIEPCLVITTAPAAVCPYDLRLVDHYAAEQGA